jgi:hypothetical protein
VKDSEVTLVNVEPKVTFRSASNESGRFLLPPGFGPHRLTGLVLEMDESKILSIELKPATLSETVNVSDAPKEVTTDRADRSLARGQAGTLRVGFTEPTSSDRRATKPRFSRGEGRAGR